MEYISVSEAAKKCGILQSREQKLCKENSIQGITSFSYMWIIPKDAEKPVDGRTKSQKTL